VVKVELVLVFLDKVVVKVELVVVVVIKITHFKINIILLY